MSLKLLRILFSVYVPFFRLFDTNLVINKVQWKKKFEIDFFFVSWSKTHTTAAFFQILQIPEKSHFFTDQIPGALVTKNMRSSLPCPTVWIEKNSPFIDNKFKTFSRKKSSWFTWWCFTVLTFWTLLWIESLPFFREINWKWTIWWNC